MLLVDARVGPSPIHGLGLIAREPIPAGTVIWRLHSEFDVLLPERTFAALPKVARRTIAYYAVFDLVQRCFVLSSDDDRFTNHAAEPNCVFDEQDQTSRTAIAIGEEITVDYRALGWTWFCGLPPSPVDYPPARHFRSMKMRNGGRGPCRTRHRAHD